MSRYWKTLVSIGTLAFVACMAVEADEVNVSGTDSGNFSTAEVVCEFNAQTNTFTFTATNTSALTQPGSTSTITAFGYDLPPIGNASLSGLNGFFGQQATPDLNSNFTFSDAALGSVPHGFDDVVLDFGFLTGADFAEGSVNEGLLPGESASFTVSGAAFAGLTEEGICDSIFVMFENVPLAAGSGGTDVAAIALPSGTPIPEPATAGLGLIALSGVALAATRRRA